MFVGRQLELERLYAKGGFQMVVLYGRRRVGKTALTKEFAKDKPALVFTAKIQSDALNLADFSRSIYRYFSVPEDTGSFHTWDAALACIAQQAKDTHLVFVFDEFPYAAKRNASLISTFQIACDRLFPETGIFLILIGGSNQGFMEEKVLGDTDEDSLGEKNPLFGRRTARIHLGPFGYRDAALMLPGLSSTELVEFYAVFGGTPYYLSMIDTSESLKTNAERLFFRKEGLLYEEPMMLLRQELHEPAIYSSVLDAIAAGANKPQEIADRIGEDRGPVGRYLKMLQSMRFVEKKVPYGEPREKSRKGICCISEPVFSFWYRFVQPAMDAIEMDAGELEARELFEGNDIPTYVGHWFETICLEWTIAQAKKGALPIRPVRFGSWWGADPARKGQTGIDVVAGSKRRRELFVGECKWRNSFDAGKATQELVRRAQLISGYW
jgi:AAA+ ATPase superfamily predicted ATPase